jgi:hypothetical protein
MGIRVLETGNNYITIQEAIDGTLGGVGLTQDLTIQIDGGTYYENLTFNGLTHKTSGNTLTLINSPAQTVILNGSGVSNNNIYILNVSNLVFDGINAENCNPEDTGGANVRILGTTGTWGLTDNITFKNSTIRTGYAAVRCTDYVRNVTFQNITTSNCRYGTYRFGKQQVDLQNVNFINCNITTDGLQNSGANQFQLKGIDGLNIIRCRVDGSEKIILSPWYCDNVLIDGCIFDRSGILSTTGRHILFEDSCDNWVIQNCLFTNCSRNSPIYGTNITNLTLRNNTFIDDSASKTEYFFLSNINGFKTYNNIFLVNGAGTIGFIRISNSTGNTIGNKFITQNNIYQFKNGSQRNIYNGTSGGVTLPSGSVSNAQSSGLEISSLQGISTGNYLGFTDTTNNDYTLQESSPARNYALLSQIPTKDIRNYTRDIQSSDVGAYDMNGIAPILPESILTVSVNGVVKTSSFGVPENTQVTFGNNSTNAITTVFEILNSSNTVIGSSSSFPYVYTFTTIGRYRLRMISTNNDGSDTLDLINYVTVDVLPTPIFTILNQPRLINGENATFTITDSSLSGTTSGGGITSKVWDVVDGSNNSYYQSTNTPFVISGSTLLQGSYGVKLTVSNIIGSASSTLNNSIYVNRTPTIINNIPNQVGTRNNIFNYTIPNNIFSDSGDTLTYSLVSNPSWLSLNNMVLSGTPITAGSTSATIRATDSRNLYNQTSFGINIGSGEPPVVVNQPANKGIPVGMQFYFKIQESIFYSPAPFTISIIQKPNWVDYISSELLLVGEPTINDVGINYITIRADDGFTQADCTFTVDVFNFNQISSINNGDSNQGIRGKLNNLITFINKLR